jgi:hypothetical protein
MAIGFIFNNPGQTQEQYDSAVEQLNLGRVCKVGKGDTEYCPNLVASIRLTKTRL